MILFPNAHISLSRPRFDLGPHHVRLWWVKWHGEKLFQVLWFSSVSIIPNTSVRSLETIQESNALSNIRKHSTDKHVYFHLVFIPNG